MSDLRPLFGRFVPIQPVTVAPGRFWETDDEHAAWFFRGWANLVLYVDDRGVVDPLEIVLLPDDTTSQMRFKAFWDDEVVMFSRQPIGPEMTISIPPSSLSHGVHRLRLERDAGQDEADVKTIRECRFTRIAIGGRDGRPLETSDHQKLEAIRAFLEDGVVGVSNTRWGGMVVSGSQDLRLRLETTRAARVSFRVLGLLGGTTRFTASIDGVSHSVEAEDEAVELDFEIAAGEHELTLHTDGPEDGVFLWGAPNLGHDGDGERGSVILVTLDTTRRDALSIYGGPERASPNIDALAGSSTVFDQAWSTSPWTLPSHATLFTGLYPTRHGAGVSDTRLDGTRATIAELAHAAGYRTAGFCGGALAASRWGVARGFELYRDPDGFETRGDRQTDSVEAWLDRYGNQPFFLFVNYFDPHAMYAAPAEFEARFGVDELRARLADVPGWNRVSAGDASVWRSVVAGEVEPTADALAYLEAAYLAEVAFMDHQIGRLVSKLQSIGVFDRATIILVADHGEFLGENGLFSHGCRLDPELTEIPLLVRRPAQTAANRDPRLVSQVDLYPTILDALGIDAAPRDGLPLGADDPAVFERRATVFMEEHENRIHPLFDNMTIARHIYGLQQELRRELVWNGGSRCYERSRGIWAVAECEVGWQQRMDELAAIAALPVETGISTGDIGLTDEMREHLEALGYVR
jgi:arylsulfatase A-like enzyme